MSRRPLIGVMGAGEGASSAAIQLAEELGAAMTERGWALLSGGRPEGVMAAVCRGACSVEGHLVVGVLPGGGPCDQGQTPCDPAGGAAAVAGVLLLPQCRGAERERCGGLLCADHGATE